ncbi:glycine cleavage system aminomethyltransferase GcvT [Propioniciclava flava]|uniref:Aminomethyltransferase n=1 Tax=Propioniciclava flava TaxID=2072026 RepID=A0A4Q2EFL3_9ACTN|nr:glycine cleavage system aminomethyltransferase GcvT [Propioniciclava flava]RXW32317.1 glycine cleavage system protein T [Propioniciclava flava]
MAELKTSPVHARHEALGAKFAEFSGWLMPLQYTSVVAEHTAVRTTAGLFDVSHLGNASVRGPGSRAFLNACLTNDLDRIGAGQAQYTLCCSDDGGVVDDLIQYVVSDEEVRLIPNAANTAAVVALLSAAAPPQIAVTDEHEEHAIFALQGPLSDAILASMGVEPALEYLQFRPAEIAGVAATLCRTGYTGELGYEVVCPWEEAPVVWDALMVAGEPFGMLPAGLGARDTLRTEMGYALHGHELSAEITPVMAGLGWAIGWDKPTFWGAEALRKQRAEGPTRRSRAIKAQGRGIPRPGMECVAPDGTVVGVVTSGTFSPTLQTGIGLALLDPSFTPGTQVGVQVRSRVEPFSVEKAPLVHPNVRAQ